MTRPALDAGSVTIGPTRFVFDKMRTFEGWRVLEVIREQLGRMPNTDKALAGIKTIDVEALLGRNAADPTSDISAKQVKEIVALVTASADVVLGLPALFVESLRATLFQHIRFQRDGGDLVQLGGIEDMAFNGLEPVAVYECLVRSLVVNFQPSFVDLFDPSSTPPGPPTPPSPPPGSRRS